MLVREPAAAGAFYPGDGAALAREIRRCFTGRLGPGREPPSAAPPRRIRGAVCPHAGYAYSGQVAAHSYLAMSGQRCDLAVIIGPNHWGIGAGVAASPGCAWQTPLGRVQVDAEAAAELAGGGGVVEADLSAHARDHSLEVQVPMLQFVFGDGVRILPVILNAQDEDTAAEVGERVAEVASRRENAVIIGSSDLTHYESDGFARSQDLALLGPVERLDVGGFYAVLGERGVSACGYGAVAAAMTACRRMGARGGSVLQYATSGDVSGDRGSVVGYGSVVFS